LKIKRSKDQLIELQGLVINQRQSVSKTLRDAIELMAGKEDR
jgi:hypothetical protein